HGQAAARHERREIAQIDENLTPRETRQVELFPELPGERARLLAIDRLDVQLPIGRPRTKQSPALAPLRLLALEKLIEMLDQLARDPMDPRLRRRQEFSVQYDVRARLEIWQFFTIGDLRRLTNHSYGDSCAKQEKILVLTQIDPRRRGISLEFY